MRNITDLGSFAVKNDGSEDFKKYILEPLNEVKNKGNHRMTGLSDWYYGMESCSPCLWFNYETPDVPILSVQHVKDYLLSGVRPGEEKDKSDIVCPFCNDNGFDKVGLKFHLEQYCEEFKNTLTP